MFHHYDVALNSKGGPTADVIIRAFNVADDSIADMFADESSTPIESLSGIPNAAKSRSDGNYDFFIADGFYNLRFYIGDALIQSIRNVQFKNSATVEDVEAKAQASALGVTGAADNLGTFASPIIPDSSTAKAALEALAADNEVRLALADAASTAPNKGASIIGLQDGRNVQSAIETLTVNSVAALKAIAPAKRADGMVVFLKGYHTAGDMGGGQVEFIAASTATPDDGAVFAPTTGTGRYHRRETDEITTLEFGCKGDNVADDHPRFQAWLNYLAETGEHGWIARPPVAYRIDGRLTATKSVDFDSDMKAVIEFVDEDNLGFLFALANDPFRPLRVRIPTCRTPTAQPGGSFDTHYALDDAGPYDPATRKGTCVEVQSSSWCNVYVHRPFGFVNGCVLTNAQNTGSAWMPLNNAVVEFNTVEFCDQPLHIEPKGGQTIAAVTLRVNTAFSKRLLLATSTAGGVSQVSVHGPDQLFINEPGGSIVHGIGNNINNIVVRVNWAACGKLPDTSSLFDALGNFSIPYLTGSGSSNGLTFDGNDPAGYGQGYFEGSSCTIDLANAVEIAGFAPGAGGYPIAGDVIRVRDAGANNYVFIRNLEQMPASAQPLSTTTAEADFLGGVGSAFFSRRCLVSAEVPTLVAGGSVTLYFFHQLFSTASPPKPILIVPNSVPDSTYHLFASDLSSSANRRGGVLVKNITSGSVTGQTINFWLWL